MRALELTGRTYYDLTAIKPLKKRSSAGKLLWLCKCSCGKRIQAIGSDLVSGNHKSCGHTRRDSLTKHGDARTTKRASEYRSWAHLKERCLNPKCRRYPDYGGRGIKVCARWIESYEAFLADMGRKPSSEYSLDRIDVDGNYEPSNCRWATPAVQANNTRRNVWYRTKYAA